jgi:hypothetical protein
MKSSVAGQTQSLCLGFDSHEFWRQFSWCQNRRYITYMYRIWRSLVMGRPYQFQSQEYFNIHVFTYVNICIYTAVIFYANTYVFMSVYTYMLIYMYTWARDSVFGIATGYGLDDRGVGVRVPGGANIFSFPSRPDRLWGPPNLLSNG